MRKKIITAFLLLTLTLLLSFTVLAGSGGSVADNAGLLSYAEADSLENRLEKLGGDLQCGIYILTESSAGGKDIRDFADDYYDENGLGYGADNSGVLLVIVTDTREWWISTCGDGFEFLGDSDINSIGDVLVSKIGRGDYYGGFLAFADKTYSLINLNRSGEVERSVKSGYNYKSAAIFGAVIGLIGSLIAVGIMKGKLRSVKKRTDAADYCTPGSFAIYSSKDIFLYHTVIKTRIDDSPSSGRSGSGFGGGHISSSGRSHGGGGGHF